VEARCPELGISTPTTLLAGSDFHDVMSKISVATNFNGPVQAKVLVWVDRQSGWSRDLTEDCLATCDKCLSLFDLRDGDVIEVRRELAAAVGSKYRLSALAAIDQYNALIQTRVKELANLYLGYRRIRGDGNCYYRSVAFGLIEQVIQRGDRRDLQHLHEVFKAVYFAPNSEEYIPHAHLLLLLEKAAEGQAWRSVSEFEADVLNESTGIDLALI
jgi:hypothetical protein